MSESNYRPPGEIQGDTRPPFESLLRLPQILGDKHADPPVAAIIPMSRSCWLKGCKEGRYPAPIRISERVVCWRSSDIVALLAKLSGAK